MDDDPWRDYAKDPLHSGWTYPIGRDRIRTSMLDFGVRVDSLALTMPPPHYRPLQLVRARRYSDLSHQGKRLQQDASMLDPVALSVYAAPHDHLPSAREAFAAGVLDQALRWVLTARTRGNAWQATERLWRAHLSEDAPATSEGPPGWAPLLGSVGIEQE